MKKKLVKESIVDKNISTLINSNYTSEIEMFINLLPVFGVNPQNAKDILYDEPYAFGGLEQIYPEILNMETLDEHDFPQEYWNAFEDEYDAGDFYIKWLEAAVIAITNKKDVIEIPDDGKVETAYGPVYYSPSLKAGFIIIDDEQPYHLFFFDKKYIK